MHVCLCISFPFPSYYVMILIFLSSFSQKNRFVFELSMFQTWVSFTVKILFYSFCISATQQERGQKTIQLCIWNFLARINRDSLFSSLFVMGKKMITWARARAEREHIKIKFQGTLFFSFDFLSIINILNVSQMIFSTQPHTPFI